MAQSRPVFEFFPEHADLLQALIDSEPDIADLCADFDEVVKAQRTHAGEGTASSLVRADEYRSLRLELEADILGVLDDWPGPALAGGR
jgi:hypothetical protein